MHQYPTKYLLEDGSKTGEIPLDAFVGNAVEIDLISKGPKEQIT